MRVGIFGGTFDPVHYGHLKIASFGIRALSLSEVLFVPARNTWMKKKQKISPLGDRKKMLSFALQGFSFFRLYDEPVTSTGESYSIDLVDHIRKQKQFGKAELFLFIGEDHLKTLLCWKDAQKLFSRITLVCFSRQTRDTKPPGVYRFNGPNIDVPNANVIEVSVRPIYISGSSIRKAVQQSEPGSFFLTPAVEEYIHIQKLYKN